MIPTAFAPLVIHLWQSTIFAATAGLLTAGAATQSGARAILALAGSIVQISASVFVAGEHRPSV